MTSAQPGSSLLMARAIASLRLAFRIKFSFWLMPAQISSIMLSGSSLLGLSLVTMQILAYFWAITPILGRFVLSLSPPAPKTAIKFRCLSEFSTFSMPSGVWAKSTMTSGSVLTTSILPLTPLNLLIAFESAAASGRSSRQTAPRAAIRL